MKNIVVFCASSPKVPSPYFKAAREASFHLVNEGYGIVYGGGATGLMGAVADEALKLGGSITGVIPRFMVEVEWAHKEVAEMIQVDTMHERKALMVEKSQGVLALPGGTGTLEELFEVLSLKKLGQYAFPVVLLNTDGFFDPLIEMMERMVDEQFMRECHREMWSVVAHPEQIVPAIREARLWGADAIRYAAV